MSEFRVSKISKIFKEPTEFYFHSITFIVNLGDKNKGGKI